MSEDRRPYAAQKPDGYAVTLPDQSAPGGFWFVGAYLDRETADHVARSNRRGAEVRPFRFMESSEDLPELTTGPLGALKRRGIV